MRLPAAGGAVSCDFSGGFGGSGAAGTRVSEAEGAATEGADAVKIGPQGFGGVREASTGGDDGHSALNDPSRNSGRTRASRFRLTRC